jgi:hypothetical protein
MKSEGEEDDGEELPVGQLGRNASAAFRVFYNTNWNKDKKR